MKAHTSADRLHRLLLWSFPRSFRIENGEEIALFWRLQRQEPRYDGHFGAAAYWRDVLRDAARVALRRHWIALKSKFPFQSRVALSQQGVPAMNSLAHNLRFAVRSMSRNRMTTAVCILTLALGIGVNSAIFSVIHSLLLKPLPGDGRDRVLAIYSLDSEVNFPHEFSYPEIEQFGLQSGSLEAVAGRRMASMGVAATGDASEYLLGEIVTLDYFRVLGMDAALGRVFRSEDIDQAARVAVISHGLWQRQFGGESDILGQDLLLNGSSLSVIGVMPEGFIGSRFPLRFDVWLPVSLQSITDPMRQGFDWRNNRGHWMEALGRMKPGTTLGEVRAEFDAIMSRLQATRPEGADKVEALVVTEEANRFGVPDHGDAPAFFSMVLMALVGCVLLIACANIANLMLARALSRQREIGIRRALGAERRHLLLQLLTESLLMAVGGGIAGLAMALVFVRLLLGLFPTGFDFPLQFDVTVDWTVVAFTAAISLGAGILFGMLPALRASNVDPQPALAGRGDPVYSCGSMRLSRLLVSGQLALSMVLLIGAGLFVRSLSNAQNVRTGLQAENLLMVTVDLNLLGLNQGQGRDLIQKLDERFQALPGVSQVSTSYLIPLEGSNRSRPLWVPDRAGETPQDALILPCNFVGPGYFEAVGTRILRGRGIQARDVATAAPVIVLNDTLAKQLWPGEKALGKQLYLSPPDDPDRRPLEVVGVAETGKYRTLGEQPLPFFFVSDRQFYDPRRTFYLRSGKELGALASSVRQAAREVEANLPIASMRTLEDHRRYFMMLPRTAATLLSAFSALALILALVGVFGIVSNAVNRRRGEIGLRMALGAKRGRVLGLILRQGLVLALAGLLVGVAGVALLTRSFSALLYGVTPLDPLTYTLVPLLLLGCAFLACLGPALKASSINPNQVLRCE